LSASAGEPVAPPFVGRNFKSRSSTRTAAAPGCGYENDTRERARPSNRARVTPCALNLK
jgi:hypothetical protein